VTESRSDRVRRILATLLGEDPVDPVDPVELSLLERAPSSAGFGGQEPEIERSLVDAAAHAVSTRLERWGRGDALRRLFGGIERDVLTGPGEWVELEAQLGLAAKLGSTARFTIDGQVVAELAISAPNAAPNRELRAMVRAPGPGLYELGVTLDAPFDKLDSFLSSGSIAGSGPAGGQAIGKLELVGHRILQVASGRPLVLIDADLLLPNPEGSPRPAPSGALAGAGPMIRALRDADLELAYFDIHPDNRRAAIHEALAAQQLPRGATLLFAAEERAIERLGLDFAPMFGMTALRRYLARGVPIVAIVSERFVSTVPSIGVLRPEQALDRATAGGFEAERAAAARFVAERRETDPFRWRLDQATGTRVSEGNRFYAELDNAKARLRLFELIESATHSVHLQFYQVRPGEFSEQLMVKLIQRARAGVQVRLMVDALYSDQDVLGRQNPLLRSFEAEPGVELLALSPIGSRHEVDVTRLKRRDHRKLVIVDGERALISGRNCGDVHYRGFDELPIHDYTDHDRIPWLDAHVEVEGPLVTEVAREFLDTWSQQGGKPPRDRSALLPTINPIPSAAGTGCGRLVVHHGLVDTLGLSMYEAMLDLAEDHVIVVNDFPIVSTLERAILRLISRGVRVQLLTGSAAARRDDGSMFPAKIHRTLFEHMVKARFEPLMLAGVELYEYTTPASPNIVARGGRVRPYVHAKMMAVDGRLCSIGSANLDATASFWESEANVVVEDPEFCRELELELEGMIAGSLRLDPDSEYWRSERAQRAVVGTLWPVSLYS
jgi:phosphatidylserine/phosphatidylglycerophosphate/cardiolipin synthase-like enzyme